ncbi:McrB family protein [Empedobacter tilapiae]|uniref:ATP/GTP-binding protein n=1 Tax=Empedobacter tilapiae TaxID=2491114 RepID=A0A4Z1BK62_9FLAO|nr:AAA family ATPase [Empedobacter tilapiae]TGN24342.1 ATP/GTP-binding protein [Empedobacter tilapiae]
MYKELQEEVYNWLKEKNKKDKNFTFSVRQKANKGAELNYFIGTEKSNYFSTTFWFIPVSYPGSSSDLINLVFDLKKEKIEFYIQFNQTKNPSDNQNKCDLILVQKVKERLKDQFKRVYYSDEKAKMEFFGIYSTTDYDSFDELENDLENLLDRVIPIVDEEITKIKSENPDFIAHRFTPEEQSKMLNKMDERFEKYNNIDELTNDLIEEENEFINLDFVRNQITLNQILYGPPGTGKTYHTINKAIEIANPKFDLTQDRNTIKKEYNRLVEEGQIVFTTFHQSMTYEDFIEGIKPETKDNNVIYNIKNGLFKEIVSKSIDNWKKSTSGTKQTKPFDKVFQLLKDEWEENPMIEFPMKREGNDFKILGFSDSSINFLKASGTNNHTLSINTLRDLYYGIREFQNQGVGIYYPSIVDKLNSYDVDFESESINSDIKNFVIVIDEINRGNVSQIFGELITLIEEDKRLGNDEAIEVTLPYSKEKFGVPSNLYIIGTMNTADRSVEALDTALRRRFVFEEMPPKYDLEGLQQDLFGFTASHLLETINKRIEKLLDKDHQIGHAYFINKNEVTIIDSFYKNIIPLLQEYFFSDYGKIGLVLGAGFIRKIEQDSVFANFEHLDYSQFEEKESYEIINHKGNPENFGNAIKLLMNR